MFLFLFLIRYSICIRPCAGFCCVQYQVCQVRIWWKNAMSVCQVPDFYNIKKKETLSQDVMLPFSIDTNNDVATLDNGCLTEDYVGISREGVCCAGGMQFNIKGQTFCMPSSRLQLRLQPVHQPGHWQPLLRPGLLHRHRRHDRDGCPNLRSVSKLG